MQQMLPGTLKSKETRHCFVFVDTHRTSMNRKFSFLMNDKPISDLNRTPFKKERESWFFFKVSCLHPEGQEHVTQKYFPLFTPALHPMTIGMKNGNHLDGKLKETRNPSLSALQ